MLEQADDLPAVPGWHPTVPLLEPQGDTPAVDGALPTTPLPMWDDDGGESRHHTAVHALGPKNDAPELGGRHRADRPAGRTAALRIGLVAGGLLATAGLGLGAADALGLTGASQEASGGTTSAGASDVLPVAPEFERTVDV